MPSSVVQLTDDDFCGHIREVRRMFELYAFTVVLMRSSTTTNMLPILCNKVILCSRTSGGNYSKAPRNFEVCSYNILYCSFTVL